MSEKKANTTSHPSDGYIDDDDVIDTAGVTAELDNAAILPAKVVDSSDAYDQERLNRLDECDIFDAMRFETELKATFGFAWVDDEVREPLEAALERFHCMLEEGRATVPGMFATALKVFLQGHLRGFGRYYSGDDPWPRPSEMVQAEIDARMPHALKWLEFELSEALEQEGRIAPPRCGTDEAPHCRVRLREETRTTKQSSDPRDPIELLADVFRRRVDLGVTVNSDKTGSYEMVVSLERLPGPRPAEAYLRFAAVDRETYRGDGVFDHASKQKFWDDQTNVRSFPQQFLKAGLAMWRKLGISAPAERIRAMMQMKEIDEATSQAIQAALFNTFNTAVRPPDMESLAFALANFIHNDPLRRHLVSDEGFEEPYGDRTAYVLWDPYVPIRS